MTLTYTDDGVEPTSRRPQRRVEARCTFCQAKHDGARQTLGHEGEWTGNVQAALAACGWVESRDRLYCGRHCQQRYEYANPEAKAPVEPVTKLADASWKAPQRPAVAQAHPRSR